MELLGRYICEKEIACIESDTNEKTLHKWAILLNSPYSKIDTSYTIDQPLAKALRFFEGEEYDYVCELFVIASNHANASLYGRGNTPVEALNHCIRSMECVQKTFNPKGEKYD